MLCRLKEAGMTANEGKCDFAKDFVVYYGLLFSAEGVSPNPGKIQALVEMEEPEDVEALRSFLGTITWFTLFIPGDIASAAAPLRELYTKNSCWRWEEREREAWNRVKKIIARAIQTSYFDPNMETEIWIDAGPVGLGALLVQKDSDGKDRVVACEDP